MKMRAAYNQLMCVYQTEQLASKVYFWWIQLYRICMSLGAGVYINKKRQKIWNGMSKRVQNLFQIRIL